MQQQFAPHVASDLFSLSTFLCRSTTVIFSHRNTIGVWYWLFRFVFQCIYYSLVLTAAILQVYLSDPSIVFGVFIAIIVMAAVFVSLEVLQAARGWEKYKR